MASSQSGAVPRVDLQERQKIFELQTSNHAEARKSLHQLSSIPQPLLSAAGQQTKIMSLSRRYAAQCCARWLRTSSSIRVSASLLQQWASQRRHNTTDAAANPKIVGIVDQISQLTLLETADLVSSLKVSSLLVECG